MMWSYFHLRMRLLRDGEVGTLWRLAGLVPELGEIPVSMVVVSNRVARVKANEPISGGLAAALLPAVKTSGAIWVGSSGRLKDSQKDSFAEIEPLGTGALALVDMPGAHYARFYEGFANSVLWPALHSRTDLIKSCENDYASYREINVCMAKALLRFQRHDRAFWIHDYHYLTLALEMRKLGVDRPIGFFLHTPLPNRSILVSIPHHRELMRALLAYDLIGFQTPQDRDNFADYAVNELGLSVVGNAIASQRHLTRLGAFPIGIDVEGFAKRATKAVTSPDVMRLRASLQGAKLAIGVDRVDYSKGLPNRFRAFDMMLETHPDLRRQVSFLQIGVPSRGEIDTYGNLQKELATLVGEVNGRHGEVDWTPIRYLTKGFSQSTLAGFYRSAQIGVVTPLHDGMNLVAKEYVAAQNPFDPGVLVLSEFAGAAHQLDAALLVNPNDIEDMSRMLHRALTMPKEERVERWQAMMTVLRASPVQSWFSDFTEALLETQDTMVSPVAAKTAPVPLVASRGDNTAIKLH